MSSVQAVYQTTMDLLQVVNGQVSTTNREETIDQVNALLSKREELLEEMIPPFSQEEMQLGGEMIHLDKEIQEKLDGIFKGIKQEMVQVKKQKKSKQSYANPYQHASNHDGMFLDQKK